MCLECLSIKAPDKSLRLLKMFALLSLTALIPGASKLEKTKIKAHSKTALNSMRISLQSWPTSTWN